MAGKITGCLPPTRGPKVEIIRIKTTEFRSFTLLCTAIWGQTIHWWGNRSHECTLAKTLCKGCTNAWPIKWRGYAHAVCWDTKQPCFVELTEDACNKMLAFFKEGEPLRGAIIQIRKTRGGAKGRFVLNVLERREDSERLPPELDPLPLLRWLWNAKRTPSQSTGESL